MLERFKQILQSYQWFQTKEPLLLAVSGGVDSIVLFHLLQNISPKKRPKISIAHINHQLRPEAEMEEAFMRKLAADYHVPIYVYRWQKADQPKSGLEEAARTMRYRFFKEVMLEEKINVLMTAHHQDDQVETILMRLARGSSLEQLTGIQKTQVFNQQLQDGHLVRPLLYFSKEEIYDYAQKNELSYLEDSTNQELEYTRNRFRQQIIPLLKKENPKFNQHVEQFTSDLTDLLEIANEPILKAYGELVKEKEETFSLDLSQFLKYKTALQKAVLMQLLIELYKDKEVSYKTAYIDLIHSWLLNGEVNTQLNLKEDFLVEKTYQEALFFEKDTRKTFLSSQKAEHLTLKQKDKWLKLSETERIGLFPLTNIIKEDASDMLCISEEKLELPLTIRHRQAGDRMTYKGLSGTKKIKDIFIDEKVTPSLRDRAWLVEDAKGKIIWLIPYRQMDLCPTKETDKITYVLKYKKLKT